MASPQDEDEGTLAHDLTKVVRKMNSDKRTAVEPTPSLPQEVLDKFQSLADEMAAATTEAADHTAKQIEEQAQRVLSQAEGFVERSRLVAEQIRQQAKDRAAEQRAFIGSQLRESSMALDTVAAKFAFDEQKPS